MAIEDDLKSEVGVTLRTNWQTRDGQKVPEAGDVKLGNDAVKLEGTVLYADISESTSMVNGYRDWFAAEIYKCYLLCASRIIKDEQGAITAFDGDRVMAVFIGDGKNTSAVRTALKINYAVHKIINPSIKDKYASTEFQLKHAVGVDTSTLFVAKTGVRGTNDLVWVGRSANYAAKLTTLDRLGYASWITSDVYSQLHESALYGTGGNLMWTEHQWSDYNIPVYASNWTWKC